MWEMTSPARGSCIWSMKPAVGPPSTVHIHKHLPITSRRNWAWLHNRGVAKALDRLPGMPGSRLAHRLDALVPLASNDAIRMADLVIQCGAPIYWRNEYSSAPQPNG